MQIALSRNQCAVVDKDDLPLVSPYRWQANPNEMGGYYAASQIGGKTVYMHRLIAGTPDGLVTDHRNHDTLDNRRANLRVVTQSVNMLNRKGANSNSGTGVRGVYEHKVERADGRRDLYYNVRVMVDGRSKTKNFPYTPEGFAAACAHVEQMRGEIG